VVAAAQAGDPFAYGRDCLERAYRSLLHCRQAAPNDALLARQVCDLERAVLTSRPAQGWNVLPSMNGPPASARWANGPTRAPDRGSRIHRQPHREGCGVTTRSTTPAIPTTRPFPVAPKSAQAEGHFTLGFLEGQPPKFVSADPMVVASRLISCSSGRPGSEALRNLKDGTPLVQVAPDDGRVRPASSSDPTG
jgi:hypothetical protein